MRGAGRARFAAVAAAWLLADACGLNPQPEPPSDKANRDGGIPAASGGSGGVLAGGGGFFGGAGGAGTGATVGLGGALGSTGGATGPGGAPSAGGASSTGGAAATAPDAGSVSDAGVDATGTGSDAGDAACVSGGTSTLPGVSIRFPSQPCVFSSAEALSGITFQYEVVVEQTVTIVSGPQDWGECGANPSPGGLPLLPRISGNSQSYCVCDVGLCFPPTPGPTVMTPGVYPATFEWDGVNWIGPSDFGNPKGAPFPPGSYTLTVRGTGQLGGDAGGGAYEVVGTFAVTITP